MPRITCPDNPDCFIDCDGSGFAEYRLPFGPCVAECDPVKLTDALYTLIRSQQMQTRSSGKVLNITGEQLSKFGLRVQAFVSADSADYVRELIELHPTRDNEWFVAEWSDVDVAGILRVLAEVSRPRVRAA
jgi:hypothetical protein